MRTRTPPPSTEPIVAPPKPSDAAESVVAPKPRRGGALLTRGEVADELGCSVATVKRRIRSGALPAFADGRLVRVRETDLQRYVAERTVRRAHGLELAASGRALPPGARLWD